MTPQWANDDYCDDENNTPECNYDGGACCQESPEEGWDEYCTKCECKTPMTTTTVVPDKCVFPEWANDDFCDDENNTPECNYDGGACCQISPEDGWDDYCIECECKTPITTTVSWIQNNMVNLVLII